MSDNRRVKFSSSPPLRGVLKHSEPHPRDSGVGSSSSDHTGSSGSLDERFTVRDYNIQSNNVDALREALSDTIKDVENWKNRYLKKNNEQIETRRNLRNSETLYRDACERTDTMQAQLESVQDRMDKQDVALDVANSRIQELEADLLEWKEKYANLHELYEEAREKAKHSTDVSIISGGSGEHSLGRAISQREKRDSADLATRMKERINRDNPDSASSKSSRGSDGTGSSKRSSQRTSAVLASDEPYIEKMPKASRNSLASPRHHGSYTLTTATASTASSSRKHGAGSSSHPGYRENGNYVPHPLPPDRARR
ncbi:hypothetical protein GQX73_g6193 [Xylaria multiplex]|uniref:NUDE domain-containing protein n=1 Tax=Xylaria multiplex TaxID=323545 RepID=A0A7C8IRN7_9PEZI|nr:hypothetical protein GQX73_g6193 [Xylaria multiplex]